MINILKHLELITNDVELLLNETADELWNDLNPKNADGSYSDKSLIARTQSFRLELLKTEYIAVVGADVAARHLAYIDHISDAEVLKWIITAKPIELDDIISDAKAILHPTDLFTIVDKKIHPSSFSPSLLSRVFTYTNYRSSDHCINRYKKLGFDGSTCPYCNEGTLRIVPIVDEAKVDQKMLFDIDHFYSKKRHPYLALSFYNHIPSCKQCNQSFKANTEFSLTTHIHPYDRCFDTLYNFQLNHGVLVSEPPSLVGIRKKSVFEDSLLHDLEIEARYKGNLEPARIGDLISILSKYSHLLRYGIESEGERARLKERLEDFGIISNQKRILKRSYSKLQRDTIAMFDPLNTLGLL